MDPHIFKLDTRQTMMERSHLKYICALVKNMKQRATTLTG